MKATRIILILAIATLIFCASATTAYAQAGYITGNLYRVYTPFDPNHPHHTGCKAPINTQGPFPKFVPDTNPDVIFLVPTFFDGIPLDFDDAYWQNGSIVDVWLTHGSNPATNVWGLPEIKYDFLSLYCDQYLSLIDLTGMVTVFTGEVFTFGDPVAGLPVDDGIWLEINGVLVYLQQDPHNPGNGTGYTGTYTGPSGTFPFRIIYIERNGFSARLKITHN
jgi:hypothetical protein